MDKYASEAISQETKRATHATVAMSLLVNQRGFVRLMASGLQTNQPANVWVRKLIECYNMNVLF